MNSQVGWPILVDHYSHPKADEKARQTFQQKKQQYEKEGKHIVFIDESGFSHDTPRTHGYSPKGQRCFGLKNWGAKGRTNVIGALLGTTNAVFYRII